MITLILLICVIVFYAIYREARRLEELSRPDAGLDALLGTFMLFGLCAIAFGIFWLCLEYLP